MKSITRFRTKSGRCIDVSNSEEAQDLTYACFQRRDYVNLRLAISNGVKDRLLNGLRYLGRFVRRFILNETLNERTRRNGFQIRANGYLNYAYHACNGLYRLFYVKRQDRDRIARRRSAILSVFEDVYRRRRNAQGTDSTQKDLSGLRDETGCVAHDITYAYRLTIDITILCGRTTRVGQVSGRLTDLFSNRTFLFTRLTGRLNVFFFLEVIFQISGNDFICVSRPPLFNADLCLNEFSGSGRINCSIDRSLVNDFRYALFHALKGGGSLTIYFNALGGFIGWSLRSVLVICWRSTMYIVRTTGMRGFTVSALRASIFLPFEPWLLWCLALNVPDVRICTRIPLYGGRLPIQRRRPTQLCGQRGGGRSAAVADGA